MAAQGSGKNAIEMRVSKLDALRELFTTGP